MCFTILAPPRCRLNAFCFCIVSRKLGLALLVIVRFVIWCCMLVSGLANARPSRRQLPIGTPPDWFYNGTHLDFSSTYECDPEDKIKDNESERCKEGTSYVVMSTVDLRLPFALYTFTSPVIGFLIFLDICLSICMCVNCKCHCCIPAWMVLSTLFIVGKMSAYGVMMTKYAKSVEFFNPPLWALFLLDVLVILYHIYCIVYLVGFVIERKMKDRTEEMVAKAKDTVGNVVGEANAGAFVGAAAGAAAANYAVNQERQHEQVPLQPIVHYPPPQQQYQPQQHYPPPQQQFQPQQQYPPPQQQQYPPQQPYYYPPPAAGQPPPYAAPVPQPQPSAPCPTQQDFHIPPKE